MRNYILIGDSQGVGMRNFLRQALSRRGDWTELGNAVQVGIQTVMQVGGGNFVNPRRGALNPNAEQLGQLGADLAIVVLGGNDEPARSYTRELTALVALIAPARPPVANARVLWVGPAHARGAPHPDGFYTTQTNRRFSRARAGARQQATIERKDRVAAIQRRHLPTLDVTWLDGKAMSRDLPHRPDGLHFDVRGSRTWAQRIAREVQRLNLPANPGSPTGTYTGSLARVPEIDRVQNDNRTRTAQASTRPEVYGAAQTEDAARQNAVATQTARRAEITEQGLHLPVIINALSFNFSTGFWSNVTSTNSAETSRSVGDQNTIPDTTEGPAEPTEESPLAVDANVDVDTGAVDPDDEDLDDDITGEG